MPVPRRPPIEISHILRVGLRFPTMGRPPFGRSPAPLQRRSNSAVLPGRVHYEAHTRWNSSRTLPRVWQRIHSQVTEKGLNRVHPPSRPTHQPLSMRRMLREALTVSFAKGYDGHIYATSETRVVKRCRPINIYVRQWSGIRTSRFSGRLLNGTR